MENPVLLTDAQMRDYVINGYVTIQAELPEPFHSDLYARVESIFETEGNPGNNILPRIPEIHRVFEDPVVAGALTGLLGHDYYLHPHRHCHRNPQGSAGQNMHIDSWSRRCHTTRWVMALYYPQDTPELLGPTGVVPTSHFYNTYNPETDPEIPVCGGAGTVTIIHYDLWHRAMPNTGDRNRHMLKFLFTRMVEPTKPTWNSASTQWDDHTDHPHAEALQPLWRSLWEWHCGNPGTRLESNPERNQTDRLLELLDNESETVSLNAAYRLGTVASAAPKLIQKLGSESESVRHNAGYALTALREHAVDHLIAATEDPDDRTRTIAAKLLGNLGHSARSVLSRIVELSSDPCADVREQATEALGNLEIHSTDAIASLILGLSDGDERVRRSSALSLARMGQHSEPAIPALIGALSDTDRYARANAVEALKRIGTTTAIQALLEDLATSRWCPLTTPESTF